MAYPEGDFANVRAKERVRAEALRLAKGEAPATVVVGPVKAPPTVAAAVQPPTPQASTPATQSKSPFVESLYSDLRGAQPVDPYASSREQLIAEVLRESMAPQEAVPKTNFSQFYTPEFVQEQVNQLRGNNTFGGLLAMSGDRALAPVGEMLMRQSDPNAFMKEAASEERGRQYQQWQADYTARRKPGERLSLLTQALGAIPDPRQLNAGGVDYQNLQAGVVKELPRNADLVRYTGELVNTWRPEFQQLIGKDQGFLTLLGSANAAQFATRQGLEDRFRQFIGRDGITEQDVRDAAAWYSKFARVYSMPLRNANFGSALTALENENFQQAIGFNENTDPETVRARLNALYEELVTGAKTRVKGYSAAFGPEKILPYYTNEDGSTVFDSAPSSGAGGQLDDDAYARDVQELLGQ